jgi:hypothetical protein
VGRAHNCPKRSNNFLVFGAPASIIGSELLVYLAPAFILSLAALLDPSSARPLPSVAFQHATPFGLPLSAFQLVSNYFKEETVISSFIMPLAALYSHSLGAWPFALHPLCIAQDRLWCDHDYPRWSGHTSESSGSIPPCSVHRLLS